MTNRNGCMYTQKFEHENLLLNFFFFFFPHIGNPVLSCVLCATVKLPGAIRKIDFIRVYGVLKIDEIFF